MARLLRLAAVLGLALAVSACGSKDGDGKGGSGSGGKPKVGIVVNCTNPFWDICAAGADKAAAEFGVDVSFKQPVDATVDAQMKMVDDLRTNGVDGLAVSVINPKEQTDRLKAIAGGLPKNNFLTMDNDADQTGRLCYIGVDNFAAGKECGKLVKHALPNGGTIGLFIGTTDSANSVKRIAGVLSELAGRDVTAEVQAGKYQEKYGSYTLYRREPVTDRMETTVAEQNADQFMQKIAAAPADACYVGLYAYNPAKAVESARRNNLVGKVKIVGFDEDLVTLDGIAKGDILGSISQDPFNYGYETVKWLKHVIDGKDPKLLPQSASKHSLVTKDGKPLPTSSPGLPTRKADEYYKIVSDATKK